MMFVWKIIYVSISHATAWQMLFGCILIVLAFSPKGSQKKASFAVGEEKFQGRKWITSTVNVVVVEKDMLTRQGIVVFLPVN